MKKLLEQCLAHNRRAFIIIMVLLEAEPEEPSLDAERRGRALGQRSLKFVPYRSLILRREQGDNGWVGRVTLQIKLIRTLLT